LLQQLEYLTIQSLADRAGEYHCLLGHANFWCTRKPQLKEEIMVSKKRKMWLFAVLLIPAVALIMSIAATDVWADDPVCWQNAEFNATDLDVGPRAFYDFEPYDRLVIENSNGKRITYLKVKRGYRDQGNAEYFTEGGEPPLWEVSFAEFFSRFPAGFYNFNARLIEGGFAPVCSELFTHLIPCFPDTSASFDTDDEMVTISWLDVGEVVDTDQTDINVAESDDPEDEGEDLVACVESNDLEIKGYEVIVEDEEERIFKIDTPASANIVTVPPEFTAGGGCFQYEVLAIEETGNQTITEKEFYIDPDSGEFDPEECPPEPEDE
jgi:hypothetical protein